MNKKIIKILITILFVCLPILDMLRATSIKDIEIFNFSIIELINLLLIGISFILTLPKIKKKHYKFIFGYIFAFIIYLVFHLYNTYNFNTTLLPTATHNYLVEAYYLIRIYLAPILLLIILLENRDMFNRRYYLNIMKYLVLMISGQIIILNLFRYSYGSYADELMPFLINKTSFIDVFRYNNFKELLTVGLFYSTNQISLVLFMLLPLNIYNMYLNPKIKSLLLVVLQGISMIIVGTKVAALGSILVLLSTILMYIFFVVIKNEKYNLKYILMHIGVIIIIGIILWISPFRHYYTDKNNINKNDISSEQIEEAKEILNSDLTKEEKIVFLTQNTETFKISSKFFKIYPLENDLDFWINIANRDRKINNDYRILKNDILRRVMQRNNNNLDKYFGMGYTIGTIDMERDYVYQYYLLGGIGVALLIGIYIVLYSCNVLKLFKKTYFNYNYAICLVSPLIGLLACYFSGHLFGWVSPMIILTMCISLGRVNN